MSARPSPHRDAAVLATMQALTRLENAQRIFGARLKTDPHARLACAILDCVEPLAEALEHILHDPLTAGPPEGKP